MKLKSQGMTNQKKRILLLALFLLKQYGVSSPHKQQVLSFIRSRGLMHIPPEDEGFRKAGEEVWKHDLSWQRNVLKNAGLLRMPERGIWQITEAGELDFKLWAERRPDWATDFEVHSNPDTEFDDEFHYEFYITKEAVQWGLKIAGAAAIISPDKSTSPTV
jgi:hypothetical protein